MKNNKGILEMTVSDYMKEQMKTTFDLEIPMLQGEYEKLQNGMHRYKIIVPEEKVQLLMEFFKHLAASKDPSVEFKIMGVKLNKN